MSDDDNPVFKSYIYPFTASPYYDFLDAFLLGLNLEAFFKGSETCILDIVFFIDDMFYLANNISDFNWASWEAPFMNFTKAIAGNFSSGIVDCEQAGESAINYGVSKYKQFNNDISAFLLSFLFNIMGSAMTFKSIFEDIDSDIKNQYYADIFTQYGRMIRTVFDFNPMEGSRFINSAVQFDIEIDE